MTMPSKDFNGNSLGCQPKATASHVSSVLENWKVKGMNCHFQGYLPAALCDEKIQDLILPLVGAKAGEVALMNSLSVNLQLLLLAFYKPDGLRRKIIIEKHAFPSDYYLVASRIQLAGFDPADCLIEVTPKEGKNTLEHSHILEAIRDVGDELALVLWPPVQYFTGQVFQMQEIINTAHEVGAFCGLDCAHGVGNIELKLHDWKADFAVWCGYKYLNGSPGTVGGAFLHSSIDANTLTKSRGWWGHKLDSRFKMDNNWEGSGGISEFRLGNPPPVQMATLVAPLELFNKHPMVEFEAAGRNLSGYCIALLKATVGLQIRFITPDKMIEDRGCQISFTITSKKTEPRAVFEQLRARGVVCDFREPGSIRLATVPMYNKFTDIYDFAIILKTILESH